MKPCIYLKEQTANKITSWVLLVLLSLLTLTSFLLAIASRLWQVWMLCAAFGLLLFSVAIPGWLMNTRTYRVTEQGIETGGLLRRMKLYSWNQVHSVGIYAYGGTASMSSFRSGICIFLKPVPDYFASDVAKSYYSLARKMNSIIVIDQTQTAQHELAAVYPGTIHDHRPSHKIMNEFK